MNRLWKTTFNILDALIHEEIKHSPTQIAKARASIACALVGLTTLTIIYLLKLKPPHYQILFLGCGFCIAIAVIKFLAQPRIANLIAFFWLQATHLLNAYIEHYKLGGISTELYWPFVIVITATLLEGIKLGILCTIIEITGMILIISGGSTDTSLASLHIPEWSFILISSLLLLSTFERVITKHEKEALESKLELQKNLNNRAIFMANISHEIRTPLHGILGTCSLLRDDFTDHRIHKRLGFIENSGDHLLSIVNDILDFSKLEAGKLELHMSSTSIRDLLVNVENIMSGNFSKNSNIFLKEIDHDLPQNVLADPIRLKQILLNLLSNASKFGKGKSISLKVQKLASEPSSSNVLFTISDQGPGISKDLTSKIFQAFSQADASTARVFGGTGLGLSIVKMIIEAWNGKIWVESQEGKGSQFYFSISLPEAERKNPVTIDRDPSIATDISSLRVLLVDDNEINREVGLALLKKTKIIPRLANNGLDAVKIVQQEPFDLILMDCYMPVLNGYEATKQIRCLTLEKQPQIIAVTASTLETEIRLCYEAGMNDVLTKPYKWKDLKSILEKHYLSP